MNLLVAFLLLSFASLLALAFYAAMRLKFFSNEARDLEEVRWELQELRIEEFEMLVSARADEYINEDWNLRPQQRRAACASRLNFTRDWLHRIIANATLFEQIARYCIRQSIAAGESSVEQNDLPLKVLDRAAMCHLMAAICLVRLRLLELYRIAWPFYMPSLADRFEIRGHSLVAWYQHLVEDVLELASQDQRDWMYGDLLFMLTGLVEMPEAGEA